MFAYPETWSIVFTPIDGGPRRKHEVIFEGDLFYEDSKLDSDMLQKIDSALHDKLKNNNDTQTPLGLKYSKEARAKYPQCIVRTKVKVPNSKQISGKPTVVTRSRQEVALLVSGNGKVLEVNQSKWRTLINTGLRPETDVLDLGDQTFALIGHENDVPFRCLFSETGHLLSRAPIQDFNGNAITAKMSSKSVSFVDENNRTNLLAAFSDSVLRVIDIKTGIVVGSLKGQSDDLMRPQQISNTDFLISHPRVFQLSKEDERTDHQLIRIGR